MKKTNFFRRSLATISIAVTLICSAVPAQAAATETSSVAPEEKVYTVVTDKANLLTDEQVANIETKVEELADYDAALYIENADKKTCTQRYTNELSEKMYSEVFGDYRNGVMIVFSFYEEANGYYAVHYGANVQIKEYKVSNIIEGTYHDFKTDATWVEGSFLQCVDYLKEAEVAARNNVNKAEPKDPMPRSTAILIFVSGILVFVIIIMISNIIPLRGDNKRLEEELNEAKNEIRKKREDMGKLGDQVNSLTRDVREYETWKKNAIEVKSDIQSLIDDKIARDEAKNFDNVCVGAVGLEAIIENFKRFDAAMDYYEKLSDLAKQYVTLDVKVLSQKRQETGELYAKTATQKIEDVCNRCNGARQDRYELNKTINYYNGLPLFVKLMIAESLISRLKKTNSEAESAQRRYRASQSSSYSSSHSGSSFGGGFHGGGSFGGGFHGGH